LKEKKEGEKKSSKKCGKVLFFPSSTPLYPSPSRGSSPWLKCYNPPRALPLDEKKKSVSIETGCRSPFVPFYFFFFNFFSPLQTTFFFSLLLSTEPPVRPNRFFSYPKPDPYYY
jgi:hypothetical protein